MKRSKSMLVRGCDAVKSFATPKRLIAEKDACVYPGVWESLDYLSVSASREVVLDDPMTRQLSVKDMKSMKRINNNGRPLWKKTETVIQERIVKYTTVDPEGGCQELVESEKTQTEITHMECKDTGEYAHKETTEYEQSETFNEELVNMERGEEAYVHLKSLDDE